MTPARVVAALGLALTACDATPSVAPARDATVDRTTSADTSTAPVRDERVDSAFASEATAFAPDVAGATPSVDAPSLDASDAFVTAPDSALAEAPDEHGAVVFPYRAPGCAYVLRAVSPTARDVRHHESVEGSDARPRNVHLTFAGDASRTVAVSWSTDDTTLASEVHLREAGAGAWRVVRGFSFAYPGADGRRQHEVHVCGLTPGRTWEYDVGGVSRSPVARFVTAPAGPMPVTVLVMGDSRTLVDAWSAVARAAEREGADVAMLTGDAVDVGADQSQWDALFDAAPTFWASTPVLWIHGNHEGLAEPYFAQLALPDHGGDRGVEAWYALTYGPLRVLALNDSTWDFDDVAVAQVAFLRRELAGMNRAQTPWAITAHHTPMYTTSNVHLPNASLRGLWAPIYDAFGVQADLAGHVHSYESTWAMRGGDETHDGVRVGPREGTHYLTFGGAGAPLYGFVEPAPWIRRREATRGYGLLRASATELTWTAKRDDGSTVERIDLLRE